VGSGQSHAYRGTAEWRYAAPPDSATAPKSVAPRGSTAAAKKVAEIFALAGIEIGGRSPWDLQVYDERFYQRLLSDGSLASGESYMDGWWDAAALDELCTRVHGANLAAKVGEWKTIWLALKGRIFNRQTKSRSAEVAQEHYDLGNDIYEAMLDRRMQYTCGYWKDATTLDQAQENKLGLICRKI
jgi:cyclopropane-fatty-acyl-phospholipid synthase